MSALKNRKRERFAQLRAEGMGRMQAMEQAGYKSSEANARRLDNSKDVKERRTELFRSHADYLSADIARVLIEQSRLAFSNIRNYLEPVPGGTGFQVKDLSTLPVEFTCAIQQLKVDKDGKVFIKLYDKTAALASLQRYLDPEPLPPGQRDAPPKGEQPEPTYDADDDFDTLVNPQQNAVRPLQ